MIQPAEPEGRALPVSVVEVDSMACLLLALDANIDTLLMRSYKASWKRFLRRYEWRCGNATPSS